MAHIPDHMGFAAGVATCGTAFGAIYWGFFAMWIVNPGNLPATIPAIENNRKTFYFDKEVAENLPQFFLIASAIAFVFAIIL